MPISYLRAAVVAVVIGCSPPAIGAGIPSEILRQMPSGYIVMTSAASAPRPGRRYYLVALASRAEAKPQSGKRSPARPLLIFSANKQGRYTLVARNDDVILRADDGGINGCDPFEDHRIAVKGAYVTVEQGVACGTHWTDFVTFRFDPRANGYVFDNWRTQSWSLNPSTDPNAEALVSDGQRVVRSKGRPVSFAEWRRPARG
jgi:hypothetical protein